MSGADQAPQLRILRARLQVLRKGMDQWKNGDPEGGTTVRRIGRATRLWARDEGLPGVEAAAGSAYAAEDLQLLGAGEILEETLRDLLAGGGPPASGHEESPGKLQGEGGDAPEVEPGDETTILLAEDDPVSAALLLHPLEARGFRVLHFTDGVSALEGALSNSVSLLVLDVKMPGLDGFEVLERLRKTPPYSAVPIIMLTSMGGEEDIVRGLELGADDYMLKPFSPLEVMARIRQLLKD